MSRPVRSSPGGPAPRTVERWEHARELPPACGARRRAVRRPAALLLRWPEQARGRGAVPAQRHRGQGHPGRAPRRGGRALLRVRRQEPHQRAEPRAEGGARGRARRPRHRPAGRVGQPQLGAVHQRRGRRAGEAGRRARRRTRDQRLLLVLRLPPVPRGPRDHARQARAARARRIHGSPVRQGPLLLQPPGLRAGQRRRRRRGVRRARGQGRLRCRRQAGVRHALDPGHHGGGVADLARHLLRAAPRPRRGRRRAGRRAARARRAPGTWRTARAPARRASRGWSPTSTTTWRPSREPGCATSSCPRSGSSPTTWRSPTTSIPRRWPPRRTSV